MPVSSREAKAWARESVKGLWTTPMIPMKADGSIDNDGIRYNVDHILAIGVGGIGFGFSEPWYLSISERMQAFKVFVDAVGRRVPCYIHAVDYSVPETINLVKHSASLGADAVMLWVPMEFTKDEAMACDWYEYVASQVDMPIFAYNTFHSGINFSIPAVRRIADIEAVCAFKDAVNDFGHTIEVMSAVGDQVVVSNPLESYLPVMMAHTKQQVLLGATSVFLMQSPHFQPIREYMELIDAGKLAEAWNQYYALQPLRDIWNSIYQDLWNKSAAQHPIATIKYWMEQLGMRGGPVRPPLKNLAPEDKAEFRAALEATGWLSKLGVAEQPK